MAFHDALRANLDLRLQCQELKHDLRAKYKHDRATYSGSRGAFTQKVLAAWQSRAGDHAGVIVQGKCHSN